MSDALNFAELGGQHVALLPARIVLSLFSLDPGVDSHDRGGISVISSCNNAFEPNQQAGFLGLTTVSGFAVHQCTPTAIGAG